MIYYEYTITVNGGTAKLNKDIYLFKGNQNIDYAFNIKEAQFVFGDPNSIEDVTAYIGATKAKMKLIKSDKTGKKIMTDFIPVATDGNFPGRVHFRINDTLFDEDVELGDYDFQIDLFDDSNGRVTIPPVYRQLHVLEPIFDDSEKNITYPHSDN